MKTRKVEVISGGAEGQDPDWPISLSVVYEGGGEDTLVFNRKRGVFFAVIASKLFPEYWNWEREAEDAKSRLPFTPDDLAQQKQEWKAFRDYLKEFQSSGSGGTPSSDALSPNVLSCSPSEIDAAADQGVK